MAKLLFRLSKLQGNYQLEKNWPWELSDERNTNNYAKCCDRKLLRQSGSQVTAKLLFRCGLEASSRTLSGTLGTVSGRPPEMKGGTCREMYGIGHIKNICRINKNPFRKGPSENRSSGKPFGNLPGNSWNSMFSFKDTLRSVLRRFDALKTLYDA